MAETAAATQTSYGAPLGGRKARRLLEPGPTLGLSLLAVAIALLFAGWIHRGMATLDPTARDQVHDMALAIRIREGTELSDGNRHPLLPAILAPVARREPEFFDDAKTIAVVLAGIVVLALFLATRRIYGAGLALLAVVGVLLELRLQARRICPEPLLAACLVAAAASAARAMGIAGRRRGDPCGRPLGGPDASASDTAARASRFGGFLVSGGFLSLAWLAKGSAILSLGATVLVVATSAGWRGARTGLVRAALVVAGFVVIASPLLVWNVSQGHSPTYNVNSAHVMWEDAWDVELDQRSSATPASWWERHGLADAIAREAGGLGLRGREDAQRGIEWVYGFLGVIAAAAVVRRRTSADHPEGDHKASPRVVGRRPTTSPRASERARRRRPYGQLPGDAASRDIWRRIAVATAVVWLLSMAWYAPIVASRRLLFPIFPVLLPPALDALGEIAARVAPSVVAAITSLVQAALRFAIPAAVAVAAGAIALLVTAPAAKTPAALDADSMAAVRGMSATLPVGARVLVRPSRTHPPDWLLEGRVRFVALPASVKDVDVLAWIAAETDATLLNEGLLRAHPAAFVRIARWEDGRGIVPITPVGVPWTWLWRGAGPARGYALVAPPGHDRR